MPPLAGESPTFTGVRQVTRKDFPTTGSLEEKVRKLRRALEQEGVQIEDCRPFFHGIGLKIKTKEGPIQSMYIEGTTAYTSDVGGFREETIKALGLE